METRQRVWMMAACFRWIRGTTAGCQQRGRPVLLELREGGREVRKRGRIRDMEQEVCVCVGGGGKSQASEG